MNLPEFSKSQRLNKTITFNNFIKGKHNQLAYEAGVKLSNNPSLFGYKPILIRAEVGLGKTHLANAIGNKIKRNDFKKNIFCVNSEDFITDFIDSIKRNAKNQFVQFYQSLDVLIIDDIQVFSGKRQSQETLLNLMKYFTYKNKQVLFTINTTLLNSEEFNEGLIDFINGGIIIELEKPDFNTRLVYLRNFKFNDFKFSEDITVYIAENVISNFRLLDGLCISLIVHSNSDKKPITLEFVKNFINKHKSIFADN